MRSLRVRFTAYILYGSINLILESKVTLFASPVSVNSLSCSFSSCPLNFPLFANIWLEIHSSSSEYLPFVTIRSLHLRITRSVSKSFHTDQAYLGFGPNTPQNSSGSGTNDLSVMCWGNILSDVFNFSLLFHPFYFCTDKSRLRLMSYYPPPPLPYPPVSPLGGRAKAIKATYIFAI